MLASLGTYDRDATWLTAQRFAHDHDDSANDRSTPDTKLTSLSTPRSFSDNGALIVPLSEIEQRLAVHQCAFTQKY
jgi:hypothetical protein